MRAMAKETAPFSEAQRSKWVVLDGDIDAGWIESMNTVMDDNKVLTLVSNERIPLTPSMRLVFEIHSLQHATPATVSRAGIVYVNEQEIGWAPYVESWIQRRAGTNSITASEASSQSQSQSQSNSEAAVLASLVVKYMEPLFALLREHKLAPIVPMPPIAMVKTLCDLLDGLLDSSNASVERSPELLENAFLFCAMWAFGGPLDSEKGHDHRKVFATHFKTLAKFKNVSDATAGASGGGSSASASTTVSRLLWLWLWKWKWRNRGDAAAAQRV
ncbi:hypothetical protein PINS_up009917 [Pythium insidiosum]|nr:hypothetical protein PINS_up009917 [Pythium insidiosum]